MERGAARPSTVRRIAEQRRAWNARAISLTLTGLGVAGTLFGWLTRIRSEYIIGMGAHTLVSLCAYLLVRSGRVATGMVLLVLGTLAEHLAMVASVGKLQTVPYFATVAILLAASTVRTRALIGVYLMAAGVIVMQGLMVDVAGVEVVRTIGYIFGAEVLAVVAFVLSLLHVRGSERAFELAEEREQQRERERAEREQLELELEKSRRIEALGRLAGRVAHDFNNLLSVITGSADLAEAELPSDHPARLELKEIVRTSERATRLTQQLLALGRGQIATPAALDAADEIRDMREMMQRLAGPGCRFELDIAADCPSVAIDRSHLEQLVINYVVNARDATGGQGRIVVRALARTLASDEVARLRPGEYFELAVIDDGPGFPDAVLARVFEPFFTTKRAGNGLGLATCHGIAAQLGGTVTAQNVPGEGTVVTTLLPAASTADSMTPRSSGVPPTAGAAPGSRVLVVEDDPAIGEIAARMLSRAGFEAVKAAHFTEALAMVADAEAPLAAAVIDVVLGTDRGTDLLETLRRHHPTARIVVTSAFTQEASVMQAIQAYGAQFLPKPYKRAALLEAVRGETLRAAAWTTGCRP
jgi:two-component system cell cycle sensor histidine kinase/response regulator CckA